MCMQCMAVAATSVGAASGIRAYLAARSPVWLTAPRMKAVTAVLVIGAVIAAGLAPA